MGRVNATDAYRQSVDAVNNLYANVLSQYIDRDRQIDKELSDIVSMNAFNYYDNNDKMRKYITALPDKIIQGYKDYNIDPAKDMRNFLTKINEEKAFLTKSAKMAEIKAQDDAKLNEAIKQNMYVPSYKDDGNMEQQINNLDIDTDNKTITYTPAKYTYRMNYDEKMKSIADAINKNEEEIKLGKAPGDYGLLQYGVEKGLTKEDFLKKWDNDNVFKEKIIEDFKNTYPNIDDYAIHNKINLENFIFNGIYNNIHREIDKRYVYNQNDANNLEYDYENYEPQSPLIYASDIAISLQNLGYPTGKDAYDKMMEIKGKIAKNETLTDEDNNALNNAIMILRSAISRDDGLIEKRNKLLSELKESLDKSLTSNSKEYKNLEYGKKLELLNRLSDEFEEHNYRTYFGEIVNRGFNDILKNAGINKKSRDPVKAIEINNPDDFIKNVIIEYDRKFDPIVDDILVKLKNDSIKEIQVPGYTSTISEKNNAYATFQNIFKSYSSSFVDYKDNKPVNIDPKDIISVNLITPTHDSPFMIKVSYKNNTNNDENNIKILKLNSKETNKENIIKDISFNLHSPFIYAKYVESKYSEIMKTNKGIIDDSNIVNKDSKDSKDNKRYYIDYEYGMAKDEKTKNKKVKKYFIHDKYGKPIKKDRSILHDYGMPENPNTIEFDNLLYAVDYVRILNDVEYKDLDIYKITKEYKEFLRKNREIKTGRIVRNNDDQ